MTVLRAEALLFDNDGVLVDSQAAVDHAWSTWCARWDLDAAAVLPDVHGKPSAETVARWVAPEHVAEAAAMIQRLEVENADEVRAVAGALDLVGSLVPGTWAIVTSGDRELATARLRAAGIPLPDVVVTSDDVARGKPHPEPYLTAARRLGQDPTGCLVFEDSAAGVRAAREARVRHVVGVTVPNDGTDAFARDLRAVRVEGDAVTVG